MKNKRKKDAKKKKKGMVKAISVSEALERIENPKMQKRIDRAIKLWKKKTEELIRQIRDSQRLTADDFNIRVGPC